MSNPSIQSMSMNEIETVTIPVIVNNSEPGPSTAPVEEPSTAPVEEPSTAPVEEPSTAPVEEPSTVPVEEPSTVPVEEPSTTIGNEPTPTINPEDDPENKEHYIFRAPENPYYKFDDVCAEILAKDIRSKKCNDIEAVESFYNISFNNFEKEKYSEQILKIANGAFNEFLDTEDRHIQDFLGCYFKNPQPELNISIKYEIKSARSGYIDAVNNIRHSLYDWEEFELLFKWLITTKNFDFQHSWFSNRRRGCNPYKIWCEKLDKHADFRQAALWSLAIGYADNDARKYVVNTMTEYLDENMDADCEELATIFMAANPGFTKDTLPFIPKSHKILAGKLVYKRTGECPVCKEETVDIIPVSWLCTHMVCTGCHNGVYASGKCPMCRGELV